MRKLTVLGLLTFVSSCAAILNISPRPQDPKDRPYHIETVQFAGGPGVMLAGELTMPLTGGPFKAVILITGSGRQDRNETMAGHRPYLVLSDRLTRAGYAVLRYDDRGVGKSSGDFAAATMVDFAADAVGAFNWLAARLEIAPEKIGYLGHSEGGYIAPVAAQQVPASFMVFLGAPAMRLLPDVISTQYADVLRSQGADAATIQKVREQVAAMTTLLRGAVTLTEIQERFDQFLIDEGVPRADRAVSRDVWPTPWGVGYAHYDPAPALRAFNGPVLALFGGTDLQVSAIENAGPMQELLRNPNSEVLVFDGLNHLFQPSASGSIDDYPWIDTTIDEAVLTKIDAWISMR